MREILFRGQTRRKGEKVRMDGTPVESNWVYGGVLKGTGDHSIIYQTEPDIEKKVVYTDTLGQYTGLTDKNGVKIFEGDIISKEFYTNHKQTKSKRFNGVVEYKVRCGKGFGAGGEDFKSWAAEWSVKFDFGNYEQKYRSYFWGLFFDCEVIGNIYDNPELVKV